jgi:hypothetical protein
MQCRSASQLGKIRNSRIIESIFILKPSRVINLEGFLTKFNLKQLISEEHKQVILYRNVQKYRFQVDTLYAICLSIYFCGVKIDKTYPSILLVYHLSQIKASMKYYFCFLTIYLAFTITSKGQYASNYTSASTYSPGLMPISKFDILDAQSAKAKLFQRNYGVILGVQRGKSTFFEFGSEIHWRKVRLTNPRLIAATANVTYNIADNVLGYQAGFWTKRGRIALTLGANAGYYTDFDNGSFAIGPAVGFRLLGFHLTTGYNYLFDKGVAEVTGEKRLADKVNNFHIGLRYYFPLDNKFSWNKKETNNKDKEKSKKKKSKEKVKKKKQKAKEKQKKAKQRQKGDNKKSEGSKRKPFDFLKKKN